MKKEDEMKTVDGQINIEAWVECPYCENSMDLFEIQSLRDDGYIYIKLLSNDDFGCDDFNETIECSECKKEFKVKTIAY